MTTVREIAPAKINLDLRVCRRRADGYHELDSLVVFAEVGDRLTLTESDALALSLAGPFAPALAGEDDNLVLRAARRLAAAAGRPPRVHVTLEKCLPVAAGIGGGSADAAATLRGLARLWDLSLGAGDLTALARGLGADIPVCLASTPMRLQGIGERLTPLALTASLAMLLVNPGVALATPAVFGKLRRMSGPRPAATAIADATMLAAALDDGRNDLEAPAGAAAPVIGEVLQAIRSLPGCRLARMSGSGATCFGLFADQASLARAERRLQAAHPGWWVVRTLCR